MNPLPRMNAAILVIGSGLYDGSDVRYVLFSCFDEIQELLNRCYMSFAEHRSRSADASCFCDVFSITE